MQKAIIISTIISCSCSAPLLWTPFLAWGQEPRYDSVCTLDERAYTGFKVMHENTVDFITWERVPKATVIVECGLGRELYALHLPANASVFNVDLPIPDTTDVLRLARRRAYSAMNHTRYLPGTVVGAAFKKQGDSTEWEAISPLIADTWLSVVCERGGSQIHITSSRLRSPDVLERTYPRSSSWARTLSAYEDD